MGVQGTSWSRTAKAVRFVRFAGATYGICQCAREFGSRKWKVGSQRLGVESRDLSSACSGACVYVPSPVLLTPDSRDSGGLLSHLARHTGTSLAAGGVSATFEITPVPNEIFVSGAGAWRKPGCRTSNFEYSRVSRGTVRPSTNWRGWWFKRSIATAHGAGHSLTGYLDIGLSSNLGHGRAITSGAPKMATLCNVSRVQ